MVYAGYYYYDINRLDVRLESFIIDAMKKYKIMSVMITTIFIGRWEVITKEKMENYCMGKNAAKASVNDDFESLFDDLRLGKKPDEQNWTYYLPKLTQEELDLVENRDPNYLETFCHDLWGPLSGDSSPDVPESEMRLSESKSKFIDGGGHRKTFTINYRLSSFE